MNEHQSFLQSLWGNAEPYKLLLEGIVSAIGFLLALLINGWLERKKEKETYNSMLLALHFEAVANQDILDHSYKQYFRSGLIIREFIHSTATQMLSNPLFMKYAPDATIQLVNDYSCHLSLANGYRRVAEPLILEAEDEFSDWLEGVFDHWEELLSPLRKNIGDVIALTATRPPKTAAHGAASS